VRVLPRLNIDLFKVDEQVFEFLLGDTFTKVLNRDSELDKTDVLAFVLVLNMMLLLMRVFGQTLKRVLVDCHV